MKYATPGAFRAALEQHLRNQHGGNDAAMARERKRIAFGRLLARLMASRPDSWLLKGGFALDLRLGNAARSTRDVDLAWLESELELTEALISGSTYDTGDFFAFGINRGVHSADQLGGARRFNVVASLAARRFESFVIDVGPAYESITPDFIALPPLFGMTNQTVQTVRTLPLEVHVAEKLHAYCTVRQDRVNTRTKDLIDLVLISRSFRIDAALLIAALKATFNSRDGEAHTLPRRLPAPPVQWMKPYSRLASELKLPTDLNDGHREASAFLNPVLANEPQLAGWNPQERNWHSTATIQRRS